MVFIHTSHISIFSLTFLRVEVLTTELTRRQTDKYRVSFE